ncbi:beta-1,4 N-acetylgalactosaminyltransferase 2-like isoform X2 [Pseudoliparis swirei]|uniref:beta-1,4 N-acetylgalactosaminyltransferase 2-like isoform X2 n=1 Tax=Pseudoliparis swirei TaxID=2059687 RepID=UPI0024BE43AA|nr:beta-1,4 N-acetylgalactosaminyltransferase 2-like isoform X2 [Pseudoliparis swirei]
MMSVLSRAPLQKVAVSVMVLLTCYFMISCHCPEKLTKEVPTQEKPRLKPQSPLPKSDPCNCPPGSSVLKNEVPKDEYEELVRRRAKELQQFKIRTTSVLSTPLIALPNSPLQYPIQGVHAQPLISTPVPGLALHAGQRSSYKVSLEVSKGVLTTEIADGGMVQGDGKTKLIMESSSLVILNYLLAKVVYTSTIYHIHTGDLVSFQFEEHEAVFPITIKQPLLPVLYNMGKSRCALLLPVSGVKHQVNARWMNICIFLCL